MTFSGRGNRHEAQASMLESWKTNTARALSFSLLVIPVSLDLFTFFGAQIEPTNIGRTMCSLRPAGLFARPLLPLDWLDYVRIECAGDPVEPALSIINFMLKTSLCVLCSLLLLAGLMLPGQGSLTDTFKQLNNPRACIEELKRLLIAASALVVIPALGWSLYFLEPIQKFRTSLISKFIEDGHLLLSMLAAYIIFCVVGIAAKLTVLYAARAR